MKKKLLMAVRAVAWDLVFVMVCALGVTRMAVAQPKSQTFSAIYEGIESYGLNDLAENKESFRFRFADDVAAWSYTIRPDGGRFTLQNRLREGYRFVVTTEADDTADAAQIVALQPDEPIAAGSITRIGTKSITVDGKRIPLAPDVVFTAIEMKAGGSIARRLDNLQRGDRVKVYGSPAHHVDRTFVATPYTPVVSGTPGVRTLKNFLKTALAPLGTALYVYGGAWNWQDDGSNPLACTLGLPDEWVAFFQMHDQNYFFKNPDPTQSYYPWHAYNEYHYASADCSGFVGWTLYNTFHTRSGEEGYVMSASKMARVLAEEYGFGTYSKAAESESFMPGDIVSMAGHVYIVIGRARDGSLLIIHSTAAITKSSGVQLSAVSNEPQCAALDLARDYMTRYYPLWRSRYDVNCMPCDYYLEFSSCLTGHFTWHISDATLTDPDGYRSMSAEEILADLFAETTPRLTTSDRLKSRPKHKR